MKLFTSILIIFLVCFSLSAEEAEENEWSNIGPSGARVMTIEIHPCDNQIIYLGTVENGMYKSFDGGDSWEHVGGLVANLTMREIEFHPFGPDTVYVATVDGMYKSTNSGQSWVLLEPPHFPLNEIRAMLVHPTLPNIILAGGPFSRWISTDSGETWQELNTGEIVGIDDFAYDPQNENVLYFASGSMHVGLGIWKSEDMGQSWFSIQNNLDSTGFGEAIAVDPFNSNILYFIRNDLYQQSGHVVSKSTNGGLIWFDITPESLLPPPIVLDVAVSPINQNTVFICALNDGILRSANGGTTWERINTGLNNADGYSIKIDSASGVIYLGTLYDGIYKSTNNGNTWEKISYNINLSNCYTLASNNANENLLFVLTSNLLYKTRDPGQVWEVFGPDIPETHRIRWIKVDPQFASVIYVSTGHESGFSQIDSAGFYRSTDSGESWEFYNIGLPPDNSYYEIAISISSTGVRRLFLTSKLGLYYSDNEGECWDLCSDGLPVNPWYYKIDIAPSNPDIVAVGDLSNNLFISINRGDSWSPAANIPINGLQLIGLKFDPINENIIYVSSLNSGLFKSYDRGSSWHSIINNLPIYPNYIGISPILINPLNPNNIFVCSYKRGIYQSHTGGSSWEPFNNGLDTVVYFGDMIFAPEDTNSIIYASGNKSVWTITRTPTGIDESLRELPGQINLAAYPNPFNTQIVIEFYANSSERITIEIFDIMGRKVKTLFGGTASPGSNSSVWDGKNDNSQDCPSGVYFARLTAGGLSRTTKTLLLK